MERGNSLLDKEINRKRFLHKVVKSFDEIYANFSLTKFDVERKENVL